MEKPLRIHFGERIRQLRKSQTLTQEKLAEKIGIDPKYLGAIERGERNVSLDVIEKIASGFKTEPYNLFLFSLPPEIKNPSAMTQRKFEDLMKHCDPKSRELILKISQDIIGWQG